MVAEDNQSESKPLAPKSIHGEKTASRTDSSGIPWLNFAEHYKLVLKSAEIVKELVARVAAVPFQPRDPKVWGVLTAVSNKARKRKQGLNMVLNANVHFFGRFVEDYQFRINSLRVSREFHCKIYRETVASEDGDALKSQPLVFLKDNSSNGTYVNGQKITRIDDPVQIDNGDIISFVSHHINEFAIAFVYREVVKPATSSNGVVTKRKAAEEVASEMKRVKGIEVGAADDFGSLQPFLTHCNTEMKKNIKESITKSSLKQNEMKELEEDMVKHTRLSASLQFDTEEAMSRDFGGWLTQELVPQVSSNRNSLHQFT